MIKLIPLLIISLLTLSSCENQNNKGFPKDIVFHNDGGTVMISGDDSFGYLIIYDGDEEYSSINLDNPSIIVSCDWLTAESLRGSKSLTLTAQPNQSGHKRKLKVFGYFGNEYAVINVTQKP